MNRKVFEDCVVSIENSKTRKVLWLEEYSNNEGKVVGYKVQKSVQPKSDIDHLNELSHLKPVVDGKH